MATYPARFGAYQRFFPDGPHPYPLMAVNRYPDGGMGGWVDTLVQIAPTILETGTTVASTAITSHKQTEALEAQQKAAAKAARKAAKKQKRQAAAAARAAAGQFQPSTGLETEPEAPSVLPWLVGGVIAALAVGAGAYFLRKRGSKRGRGASQEA